MSRAPHVLVNGICLNQPAGGVQRHNRELLPRLSALLQERGGSLSVLEGKHGLSFELPDSIARIPSKTPDHPVLVRASLETGALRTALEDAQARGRPFDLVHTAHLPVPRRLDCPMTLTLHDLRSLELEHTPMSRRLIGRNIVGSAVRKASHVFVVSDNVRQKLRAWFRLPHERITVIGNGCDHFEPLPHNSNPSYMLHVGHLEPRKNVELLLASLALDPALPDLWLCGAPKGPKASEQERLQQAAEQHGVTQRVHFRGGFEDSQLPELYANAACVVLPSLLEGFGIPALEAMRANVPVAVSTSGALSEVSAPFATSFDPADAQACASAIHLAIERWRDDKHANAAREHAEAYSWDRCAERLLQSWNPQE